MLQLVQSSAARPAGGYFSGFVSSGSETAKPEKFVALAVRDMQAIALCGRQSCLQAAFQAAVQQTTHAVRTYPSGFVFAGIPQRSLRNSLLGFGRSWHAQHHHLEGYIALNCNRYSVPVDWMSRRHACEQKCHTGLRRVRAIPP
jgi:hypothetical protein